MAENKLGLVPEEAKVIDELEQLIGRSIPHVKGFDIGKLGFSGDTRVIDLNLQDCELTYLPESITQLKALQSFYLDENHLTDLPEQIGNLRSLHTLSIINNKLRSVPSSIGNLTALIFLIIFNCKDLNELPEQLGNLRSLQHLWLIGNGLTKLPESIGNLTSLLSLNLGKNKLKKLPKTAQKLKLRLLDLSNNQFEIFPKFIGNMKTLEWLVLSGNKLTMLPPLSRKPTSLEKFNLSKNKLKTLPKWVFQLKKLTSLHLEENPWAEGAQVMDMLARNLTAKNALVQYFDSQEGVAVLKTQEIEESVSDFLYTFLKKERVAVFMSYAVQDSARLQVSALAEALQDKSDEELQITVHYWEGWDGYPDGNIVDFMQKYIVSSDIFIPICTKAMHESKNCKKERDLAYFNNKLTIPVFEDFDHVPPIFKPFKGIDLSQGVREAIIKKIYEQVKILIRK